MNQNRGVLYSFVPTIFEKIKIDQNKVAFFLSKKGIRLLVFLGRMRTEQFIQKVIGFVASNLRKTLSARTRWNYLRNFVPV